MNKGLMRGLAVAILVAIAVIYLPVIHGGFLWDDWPSMRDLVGDRWAHYVFRDFNHWTYYFRPLPVAFFALQLKLFHSDPGPMHAISLGLHLVNTALVGLLSYRVSQLAGATETRQRWAGLICMALYGLHPALIEPVVWVGLQTDLIVTMLTLCGLLATTRIESRATRAIVLPALFFFAACTKEAASVFPVLIVLFDWALFASEDRGLLKVARRLLQRNGPAYAGILVTGAAYLALRHWALGKVDYPAPAELSTLFARFQEVCFIYLSYLKIVIWPIAGMGPLHPVDVSPFKVWGVATTITDVVAVGLVGTGLYLAIRRASALGFLILAVTTALLPVLRILPVAFERSLYHERYAMIAVAMSCALLPLLKWPRTDIQGGRPARVMRVVMPVAIFLWLAFAIVDIRIIVPKWNSDTTLWEWTLATNPDSPQAQDSLLLTYEQNGNLEGAQKLGDALLANPQTCTSCMLHLAKMALDHDDPARAAAALDKASDTLLVKRDKETRQFYFRELGRLLNVQARYPEAEQVLEAALALDPKDDASRRELAKTLAALHGEAKSGNQP